jgi:protein-L-isoaspartate(D-aspartate) O-methyltransferase
MLRAGLPAEPGARSLPGTRREDLIAALRAHVDDERVLAALAAVPRERFVPEELRDRAWENGPLPIGEGQTISQPLVVARMCELLRLRGDERVLDVGTGSGYHAAVLARLCAHVWTIERHASLSRRAEASLEAARVENVTLVVGDGTLGHPAAAPYDAVNVAAEADVLPPPLEAQLAPGGRLVAPVAGRLIVVEADGRRAAHDRVAFVPLVSD